MSEKESLLYTQRLDAPLPPPCGEHTCTLMYHYLSLSYVHTYSGLLSLMQKRFWPTQNKNLDYKWYMPFRVCPLFYSIY